MASLNESLSLARGTGSGAAGSRAGAEAWKEAAAASGRREEEEEGEEAGAATPTRAEAAAGLSRRPRATRCCASRRRVAWRRAMAKGAGAGITVEKGCRESCATATNPFFSFLPLVSPRSADDLLRQGGGGGMVRRGRQCLML